MEVLSHDPYYKYDKHSVHFATHTKLILSPEFKDWDLINQIILINHNDMHHYELQAQKEQQMMDMMASKGGAPPGQPGGAPPDKAGPMPAES